MTNVRYNGKLKNVVVFNDKKNDIRNWLTEIIMPTVLIPVENVQNRSGVPDCSRRFKAHRLPLGVLVPLGEVITRRVIASLLHLFRNLRGISAVQVKLEDFPDDLCRFFIDHPFFRIVFILPVAIGRINIYMDVFGIFC